MTTRPLVRLNRALGWDKWEFRYAITAATGEIFVAQPALMAQQDRGREVQPLLALESEECQMLMDELYATGFRPTEGKGSAGAMKATETHLADMQKIAFMLLGRKK